MPFIWVAVALLVLIVMQRWIHAHLHGLSLLITGRPQWAVALYAIILFPGVLLHEVSHWLMATVLGVRTGSMSLVPRLKPDGSVQLGYVEYYKGKTLGPIRESLIGGAPLLAGTAVILLIGFRVFSVTSLAAAVQTGSIDSLTLALGDIFATNDILVWLYLLFAISNAMLPSPSDRRAWPAFLLIMAVLTAVLFLIGLDDEIMAGLACPPPPSLAISAPACLWQSASTSSSCSSSPPSKPSSAAFVGCMSSMAAASRPKAAKTWLCNRKWLKH